MRLAPFAVLPTGDVTIDRAVTLREEILGGRSDVIVGGLLRVSLRGFVVFLLGRASVGSLVMLLLIDVLGAYFLDRLPIGVQFWQ